MISSEYAEYAQYHGPHIIKNKTRGAYAEAEGFLQRQLLHRHGAIAKGKARGQNHLKWARKHMDIKTMI